MTYRQSAAVEIRFVCMVCLSQASSAPAVCTRCHVALSDSDVPELGAELLRLLRRRARLRPAVHERRRMGISLAVAAPLALVGMIGLASLDMPLPRPSTTSGMGVLLPAFLLWFALTSVIYLLSFRKPPAPWPEAETASMTELAKGLGLQILDG